MAGLEDLKFELELSDVFALNNFLRPEIPQEYLFFSAIFAIAWNVGKAITIVVSIDAGTDELGMDLGLVESVGLAAPVIAVDLATSPSLYSAVAMILIGVRKGMAS